MKSLFNFLQPPYPPQIDRKYNFHYIPMAFPLVNVPNKFHNETLIDAEMVVETDGDKVCYVEF